MWYRKLVWGLAAATSLYNLLLVEQWNLQGGGCREMWLPYNPPSCFLPQTQKLKLLKRSPDYDRSETRKNSAIGLVKIQLTNIIPRAQNFSNMRSRLNGTANPEIADEQLFAALSEQEVLWLEVEMGDSPRV